jgi:tRNA-modifying protein YgfZ
MAGFALPRRDNRPISTVMSLQIAQMTDRAAVRVTGPDARPFLHNLLTQDVETLTPGVLRYGALLSPPGRMLMDLFLLGLEDGVLLDVPADRREALLQRLSLYKLRAKVEVVASDEPVFAAWGGDVGSFIPDPRLPALGGRGYGGVSAPNASEDDYAAHRMALGVPDPPRDAPDDKTYPIEANLDLLNGIDFRKGCFVGQETTSRMKRRGTIKSRMLPIAFNGPPPSFGAEVLNGDLRAGQVLSGRDGMAMALMRLDRMDGALSVDGRPVSTRRPDWIALA